MKELTNKEKCIYRLEELKTDIRKELEVRLRLSKDPSIDELMYVYQVINDYINLHDLDRKVNKLEDIVTEENAVYILRKIQRNEKVKASYIYTIESLSGTYLKKETKVLKKVKE